MKKLILYILVFPLVVFSEKIDLAQWDKDSFQKFLIQCQTLPKSEKIEKISEAFLDTVYQSNTLHGSVDIDEKLIIDLSKVDCFTFIDYVEAMKRSGNFEQFKKNLVDLRYQFGSIQYTKRNHFFSDWIEYNDFENITAKISSNTQKVMKHLNQFEANKLYLQGIEIKPRMIEYIDSKYVDIKLLEKLKSGDYIGIYTHKEGLDVSHTGLIIKKDSQVFFRHASSKKQFKKVVDEPFLDYIKKTPGFIVLRPS